MDTIKKVLDHFGVLKSTQNDGTKLVYVVKEIEFTYFTSTMQCFRGTQEYRNVWTLKEAIRKL